jgi:hypothetical protein
MRHYYTNTELSTYRRCRRKWWFSEFLNLTPRAERVSEARDTGTVVHDAFNALYSDGDPVETITYEIAQLRDKYSESEGDLETIDKIERLSIAIVTGYLEWLGDEGEDQGLVVLGSEMEMIAPLPNTDDLALLGKFDLKWFREMDGARVFVDHKVVGNLTDLPSWIHLDTQFKHYHMLERMTLSEDEWSDGGMLNMAKRVLRTGRSNPPFYKRYEVRHNLDELRSHFVYTYALIAEIEDLRDRLARQEPGTSAAIRPNPMRSCTWECPFFSACPMADDQKGADLGGFLESAYTQRDPLERYSVSHGG